jgi:hypothetical protein
VATDFTFSEPCFVLYKCEEEQLDAHFFSLIYFKYTDILYMFRTNKEVTSAHVRDIRGEARRRFWWGNLMERDHWGDPGVDRSIILRWICRKWDVGVRTGLNWLRVEKGVGHL